MRINEILTDNKNIIINVARAARRWIEKYARENYFGEDLMCLCGIASGEIWKRLKSAGIKARIHEYVESHGGGHCFVEAEGYLIDITASQYTYGQQKYPKVIVRRTDNIDPETHYFLQKSKTYNTLAGFRKAQIRCHWPEDQVALENIFEASEDGTFAGVKFSNESVQKLKAFSDKNNIPNPTPPEDYHVTLLFSRTPLPDYTPRGSYKAALTAIPKYATIFGDDDEKALVIVFDAPGLVKRHKYLMRKHPEATWDHDDFIPHVTLSYDVGDFDPNSLNVTDIGPLDIVEEYVADIEADWEKNL